MGPFRTYRHCLVAVALTLAFSVVADHGGPHEPDTVVIGTRPPPCPDGAICLRDEQAREFLRQLRDLIAQESLRQLEGARPGAPEDDPEGAEVEIACEALFEEFKTMFDSCMTEADKAWGKCRAKAMEGVGSIIVEALLGRCSKTKDADEKQCSDDYGRRRGLLAPLCGSDGS